MIGQSPLFLAATERVMRFAHSMSPVLITGETGVGKELLAHFLHEQSGRTGPFIAMNCAALPETLIEAELFGHDRGAFTGALHREGKFRAAQQGTLFLDEISECSPLMQSKLLRVIQEQEVSPLGSDRTVSVDVRIVVATNTSLAIRVAERKFRDDLY